MFKKLAMVGVLGALGAGLSSGTGAWSYVKTGSTPLINRSATACRSSGKSNVPAR